MGYTWEKDVPLPNRIGRPAKFPFADMEVGESILVDKENANSARFSVYGFNRRNNDGMRFTTRRTVDGLRIWRVS